MTVLITGFGAYDLEFDRVDENASWEGVRRMNKEEMQMKLDVNLVVEYVPVSYNEVFTKLTDLWQQYQQFELVIHVGLAKQIQCLKLEKQANKGSYYVNDCDGCIPEGNLHPTNGMDSYITALNLEAILEDFNAESPAGLTAEISEEAGKFLCEYIYYTSLFYSESKKVLFVHVPHEIYSYDQLARGLERLLELILKHY